MAHVGRKLIPFDIGRAERLLDVVRCYPLLAQFRPNPDGPLPPLRVMMDEAGHEPLVGYELLRAELLYDALDSVRIMTLCGQLTFQLLGAVLSPGEQAYSRNLDRFVIGCHGGLKTCTEIEGPAGDRIRSVPPARL